MAMRIDAAERAWAAAQPPPPVVLTIPVRHGRTKVFAIPKGALARRRGRR